MAKPRISRVIDEDVNPAEASNRLFNDTGRVLDFGRVSLHREHLSATVTNLLGSLLQIFTATRADRDVRCLSSKLTGHSAAYPSARGCHQSHLACQPQIHGSPSLRFRLI